MRIPLLCGLFVAIASVVTTGFVVPSFQTRRHYLAPSRHSLAALFSHSYGDARGAALTIEDASVYRGSNQVLSSVNWRVEPFQKWALVGANGCGKSTLLQALVGDLALESGSITISTTQTIGYLQQTAVAGSTLTIYEEAASAMKDIQEARAALEEAQALVQQDPTQHHLDKLDAATSRYEAVGGYTQEQTVSSVLHGLGFSDLHVKCSELSGGWQMRVALAKVLLEQPSLLILDEPSNHLDRKARNWLANYLCNYNAGAMILCTHDVTLLDATVQHIAEVGSGGTLHLYKSCTYSQYKDEKQRRMDAAQSEFERNQAKAAKLQAFVDRFGASATKASAAQSRVKQIEKMRQQGLLDDPTASTETTTKSHFQPTLSLPDPPRAIGETLVSLKNAQVGWTTPLVSDIDLDVTKGMKLWLCGPNGCGKSTILATLRGTLDLMVGTRMANEQLCLGVFTQDLAQELDPNARAVDLVLQYAQQDDVTITEEAARSVMGRLGLTQAKSLRTLRNLSGGEKARVALSMFCLKPSNLLLLDEASNHLDRECMHALSTALRDWNTDNGAMVVVSHDPAFLQDIDFTHVGSVVNGRLTVEQRGIRDSDWDDMMALEQRSSDSDEKNDRDMTKSSHASLDRTLQRQAYNAPKRIAKLEQLIENCEVEVAELEEEMMNNGSNVDKLLEMQEQKEALETKISEYMEEWEQLEELLVS